MKKLILALSIFISFSCSDMLDEIHFEIERPLKPFIEQFKKEATLRHSQLPQNLIVRFDDVIKNYGVIAITLHEDITKILIDHSIEDRVKSDSLFVSYVVGHEIGHALGRPHCYDCYSLMNPNKYIQVFRFDSVQRKILVDELFKY